MPELKRARKSFWVSVLGALGVVYGDIGTSPLYALQECFHHGLAHDRGNIFGVLSLIIWSLVIVISVKYVLFIMRADNHGEGGILALIALVAPHEPQAAKERAHRVRSVIFLGIFGAALLFGDGMITPAISVLSAVEGLKVATPWFAHIVVPLTVLILCGLFLLQRQGTAKIGAVFGPVMVLWFGVIGALGAYWIARAPEVLLAFDPRHAVAFFLVNRLAGLLALGAVFLAVTGGEALYADMGHFGRSPIRWAWFAWVLPALLLNYLGQGALLLIDPASIENSFFRMAPRFALYPLVALSTVATVIASQALISGVFSLTRQAIQLGYLPRLSVIHTSREEIGQVYVPAMNWLLLAATIWLVLTFRTSSNLASAYGLAVTGTMMITTLLAYYVARLDWGWSRLHAVSLVAAFLVVDVAFFASNLAKVVQGGWFPLGVGGVFYLLMITWRRGRGIMAAQVTARAVPFSQFMNDVAAHPPIRVPGTAVYLTHDPAATPAALLQNLKHQRVLHECVALLTFTTVDFPYVQVRERVKLELLGPGFTRIVARHGFMQTPKILGVLELARQQGFNFDPARTTFFLGHETILASSRPAMAIWRQKIFGFLQRNAQRATTYYQIPPDQVIEVGLQVEI
jgi:KUP system potassium uptake protein